MTFEPGTNTNSAFPEFGPEQIKSEANAEMREAIGNIMDIAAKYGYRVEVKIKGRFIQTFDPNHIETYIN